MLGDKIRKIRKSEGLTVSKLAESAGVSESYISQLERGLVDPSVSLLRRLAASLNVSIASFFDDDGNAPIITRLEDREQANSADGKVSFSWISPEAENLRLEMVEVTIQPDAVLSAPANRHYVCLFVTEGTLEIRYGDTSASLRQGDTIFIPSHTAYVLTSGHQGAKGLLCVSKGGEA